MLKGVILLQESEAVHPEDAHINGITEGKSEKCDTYLSVPKTTRVKHKLSKSI
jgi:hypothetical protein